MVWNLNDDDTSQNFGVIKISLTDTKNKKIKITWMPNNKQLLVDRKPLNWQHKGTPLGVPIRQKLEEFRTNELIFENVQWQNYDYTQPDFLLDRIWTQLFNEILM